ELLLLEEPMRKEQREHAIEDRGDASAPSAERIPAERHEQRHRANGDHAAQVVEDVYERKARLLLARGNAAKIGCETIRLFGAHDPCPNGAVQIRSRDLDHVGFPPGKPESQLYGQVRLRQARYSEMSDLGR